MSLFELFEVSISGRWTRRVINHQINTRESFAREELQHPEFLMWNLSFNSVLTSLDLLRNILCGVDEDGDGEYDASGITALSSAISVNSVLIRLKLASNRRSLRP